MRCFLQHGLAIQTGANFVFALDVARLDDLRRRRNLRHIEFGEGVYVFEQIAKLRAETLHLIVGERNARELSYIANVNLLG